MESTLTMWKPRASREFPGVPQEDQAVAALPAGVGIGEVHPDVAQRRRSENGVGDGVRQHVGVGVPFQPEFAGYRHPSQN